MTKYHLINTDAITLEEIAAVLKYKKKLKLSDQALANIIRSRDYLDQKINASDIPFYGINTGFGSLRNVKISHEKLSILQENLVMSHASGIGDKVRPEIVKLMLLLKIQSLSYGHSGISKEVVERLIDFFNMGILPVVYEQGSLGASGDLAPLAHMSLPILGKGKVYYRDEIRSAAEVLKEVNLSPLQLKSKEGLALLNGTQFMSAHAVYALIQSKKILDLADLIGAVSADAYDCSLAPYDHLIHEVRPHPGQLQSAKNIFELLRDSPIANRNKKDVQDPYSFRCMPQVHGATRDVYQYVKQVVTTEVNSVTDNPNIFVEEDKIISGGNFHGQPLALAMDFLAISLAEIGNISERRIYKLVSGKRDLPVFLATDPGINSGFMIPQYTAASIVSQNKQLGFPASIDSITSSNGQEDHVSMGANAATKLLKVLHNVFKIMSIELFNASQALSYREPLESSAFINRFVQTYREKVPLVQSDKIMADEIKKTLVFLENLEEEDYDFKS